MGEADDGSAGARKGRLGGDGDDGHDGPDVRDPISRFAPHLREEFEALRGSEDQILRSLEDPAVARRFAADPARTLEEIGLKVPPALKARLVANRPGVAPPTEQRFRLPNGQVVTAHVKVRFTRAEGDRRAG